MVHAADELEAAFAAVVKEKADALVFQPSLPTQRVVELALAHRLPTATSIRAFAEIGGLLSYGSDGPALFRRAAAFVHKTLRGEKPGDIPVEQPTKFNLIINLKTAKAIGITVPPTLLARADEVIECGLSSPMRRMPSSIDQCRAGLVCIGEEAETDAWLWCKAIPPRLPTLTTLGAVGRLPSA